MANIAGRLDLYLRSKGLAIEGVSIGRPDDRATWIVHPASLQASAQPHIDGFDLVADDARAHDAAIDGLLDTPLAAALLDLLAEANAPDVSQQIQPSPKGATIQRPASPRDALRDRLKGHLQRRVSST